MSSTVPRSPRLSAWNTWYHETRRHLATLADIPVAPHLSEFLVRHYAANEPMQFKLPHEWPLDDWSLPRLRERIGDLVVEVEVGRSREPDYDIKRDALRARMPFSEFIDRVLEKPDNDLYLTAHNTERSRESLWKLFQDFRPHLPMLNGEPHAGFLWIGGRTETSLHHDLTNNLICQLHGIKMVRMVSPLQTGRIRLGRGVFSEIKWLTRETAQECGLCVQDVVLFPGDALFVPIGWWHCVAALSPSATVAFTNFLWNNCLHEKFPR